MRLCLITAALLLAACTSEHDKVTTPDSDKRAHEQMDTAADETQEAVHGVLDKAENVEVVLDQAAEDRQAAIEEAGE